MGTDTLSFSQLSEEAQDLIVSATLGEFDESGPPPIKDSVLDELWQWLTSGDDVETTPTRIKADHGI